MMSMRKSVAVAAAVCASSVLATGAETAVTWVVFKNGFAAGPHVVGGQMSQKCKEYMEGSDYAFRVPFGGEEAFMQSFRQACEGVSLRASLSQTFNPAQACAGVPNSVSFFPNDKLGEPIPGEPYYVAALDVTCIAPPSAVYPHGSCDAPVEPTVYGEWNITPLATYYVLESGKYDRAPMAVDFSKCVLAATSTFMGGEDKILKA